MKIIELDGVRSRCLTVGKTIVIELRIQGRRMQMKKKKQCDRAVSETFNVKEKKKDTDIQKDRQK